MAAGGIAAAIAATDANTAEGAASLVATVDSVRAELLGAHEDVDTVLAGLNYPMTTAGGILLLEIKARATTPGSAQRVPFFQNARRLLLSASFEQIKHVKKAFLFVCRQFAEDAIALGAALQAVRPLEAVLHATTSSRWCLTSVHTDFLQVCLSAKAYKAAARLAEVDVFEVESNKALYQPLDFVRYWLYAGMATIGLKRWERAIECLRNCVTTPATALSAVVVEAYKKYVLVSLIARGHLADLPKFTPSVVTHNREAFAAPYLALADAFKKMDADALAKAADEGREKFEADKNWGLVKQVQAGLTRRRILRLTHFYVTVSLADVARNVGLGSAAEAQALVEEMIGSRDIFASIDESSGMVAFLDAPESFASPAALARLSGEVAAAMKLSERLRAADEEMQADGSYVRRTLMQERRSGGAGVGTGGGGMMLPPTIGGGMLSGMP